MIAVALALAAQLPEEVVASKRVIGLFRSACVQGQLSLSKSNAVKMNYSELPNPILDKLIFDRPIQDPTVIRFSDLGDTYLIFGKTRSKMTRCLIYSKSLMVGDGLSELNRDSPAVKPRQAWGPDMYFHRWLVLDRRAGYQKLLDFMLPGWPKIELSQTSAKQAVEASN